MPSLPSTRPAAPASAPDAAEPRQVLLFSGHMVDAPGRAVPRFPAAKVKAAQMAIESVLDRLQAGPADLALTQGAAGGDLLFAEACLARGVPLRLLLPLDEPAFVAASLLPSDGGAGWLQRYRDVVARLAQPPQVMAEVLGPGAPGGNPFERCNEWLLDTARAHGSERVRLVCLWDGGGGDGPGGTRHMVETVRRGGGQVDWIDVRAL